jgi:hypothetical protein
MKPRTIEQLRPPYQQIATVRTRPFRVAYIVNRAVEYETLRAVTQYNCCIWGGTYNAFIPTDGELIREDWWYILYHHDPDYIVYVGDMADGLLARIYEGIEPLWHFRWGEGFLEELHNSHDALNGVLLRTLFHHLYSTLKLPPETSNCVLPEIGESAFSQYLEIAYGSYPAQINYAEAFTELLGAVRTPCSPATLETYLALVDALNRKITPLDFTGRFLRNFGGHSRNTLGNVPTLIISKGGLDDLFLYHASTWIRQEGRPSAIVPFDMVSTSEDFKLLATWIGNKIHGNLLQLQSLSISLDELRPIRDQLRAYLPPRSPMGESGWCIQLRTGNFDVYIPDIADDEKELLITREELNQGDKLSFIAPTSRFTESIDSISGWAIDIILSPYSGVKYGFAPSMFPDLNFQLSGYKEEDRQWFALGRGVGLRVARGRLSGRMATRTQSASIRLASAEKLIKAALKDAGYTVKRDEKKGAYYQGMVRLAGGQLEDILFMREPYFVRLFSEAKLRKGNSYTYSELKTMAAPKQDTERFTTQLHDLADKQIFLRGYRLKCPVCDLDMWYAASEVDEHVICKGCRSVIQLPLEMNFTYRLNQLFSAGLNQGGATVLLTLSLLYQNSEHGMMWEVSYKARKNGRETDLDLIAMCDGMLVLAECKNDFDFNTPEKLKEVMDQLQQNIVLAQALNANLFLFTTLCEGEIPSEIINMLADVERTHPNLAVRLVGREDLLKGCFPKDQNQRDNANNRTPISELLKPLPFYSEKCFENDPSKTGWTMLG